MDPAANVCQGVRLLSAYGKSGNYRQKDSENNNVL